LHPLNRKLKPLRVADDSVADWKQGAWDGEGEGEGTPDEENAEEEEDDVFVPLSVAALYHEEEPAEDDRARPGPSPHPPTTAAAAKSSPLHNDPNHDQCCPVCYRPLDDVADTELARVAHVNACLDEAFDPPGKQAPKTGNCGDAGNGPCIPGDIPGYIPDPVPADDVICIGDDSDGYGGVWDEGGEGEWHDVAAWLHAVDQGAAAEAVVKARVTFTLLDTLTDGNLREMGVGTLVGACMGAPTPESELDMRTLDMLF